MPKSHPLFACRAQQERKNEMHDRATRPFPIPIHSQLDRRYCQWEHTGTHGVFDSLSGIPLMLYVIRAVLLILFLSGLRISQEYQRGVVFRLGRYKGLRGPGLFWIIPLGIERAVIIDIRTKTVSAEQQETITRDSVTIKVNAVLWYRIIDAAKSVIAVAISLHSNCAACRWWQRRVQKTTAPPS